MADATIEPPTLCRKISVYNPPHAAARHQDAILSPADFAVCRLEGTPFTNHLASRYGATVQLPPVRYNNFLDGQLDVGDYAPLCFQQAGPHALLHFDPHETVVGIVTCGGLCPGLNNVIQALTTFSLEVYKMKKVIGFRYGYRGLCDAGIDKAIVLTRDTVRDITKTGGSFLGTSRGYQTTEHLEEIARNLKRLQVNILFCLGGDGTMRGAHEIAMFLSKQNSNISVIGIPKTIDNDIAFVEKTFGFETAVNEAVPAITAARAEARSAYNGFGVVKLMGRHSGFIAAQAALSHGQANIVLIPENPISFQTLLDLIDARLEKREYGVLIVAEGWGEDLLPSTGVDASGNKKLGDIGIFLKKEIEKHLASKYAESTVKYIDPSYMIRACVATPADAGFCLQLANHAIHEALFGSTDCLIGYWSMASPLYQYLFVFHNESKSIYLEDYGELSEKFVSA